MTSQPGRHSGRPPGRRKSPRVAGTPVPPAGRRGGGSARPELPKPSAPHVDAPGATVIYGKNPVKEALRGRKRVVERLWVLPGRAGEEMVAELRVGASRDSVSLPAVRPVPAQELALLAGSLEHQGVVARTSPYPYAEPEELLGSRDLLVALDRVQDPHNLGAVIRTADASGAGVVIPRHRAVEVTGAVVKASAGATEHVPVARVRNLADFLAQAKDGGFWIYGAAAGAPSAYDSQDYRGPVLFVLGSEGQGLSRRVEAACDVLVSLPLLGAVASLNVSVTAGVLLFEVLRQRAASGVDP